MTLHVIPLLLAGIVGWYSTFDYARDTARGRLRPSLTSWLVWTTTAGLGTGAAIGAGSTIGAIMSGVTCLRCAQVLLPAVFVTGRNWLRKRWGLPIAGVAAPEHSTTQRVVDIACLVACAGIGVIWWSTADDLLALTLAIAVDGVAAIPTIWHGWHGQEHPKPYLLGMVTPIVALGSVSSRVFADCAWPLYELTINILLVIPPLVVGWPRTPTPVRPPRRQKIAAPIAGVAVVLAATAWVFLVVPPSTPAAADAVVFADAAPAALPVPVPAPPAAPEAAPVASAAIPSVTSTVHVPPTPGYIELTPNGRQAWIAHRDTGIVSVLDVTTGQIVGALRIPAGPPQFVAFCPDGGRAYVSVYTMGADGRADSSRPHVVAVLDTASIAQVAEIPVGRRPFASDCAANGKILAVPSHDDAVVDFIDTTTNRIAETIAVPANPHWVTHTADGRWWTANHESNVVTRIDDVTYAQRSIPLTAPGAAPGRSPHSLAVSPDGTTLAVVTYDSQQVWLIDTKAEAVIRAVTTAGRGPQDVAWAPDGRHLYTTDVDGDVVSVIDPTGGVVTAYPSTGDGPVSVATSHDGRSAYVANLNSATITVLDTGTPAEK